MQLETQTEPSRINVRFKDHPLTWIRCVLISHAPVWIVLVALSIASWAQLSAVISAQRDNERQDRQQEIDERQRLSFCRDRNDTLRNSRQRDIELIRIDSETFLAAGVDAAQVTPWERERLSTIPPLTELVSDCDTDGVNGDRGDYPRGAD